MTLTNNSRDTTKHSRNDKKNKTKKKKDDKYDTFTSWARDERGVFISEGVRIGGLDEMMGSGSVGSGVFARRDLEVIMLIAS